MVFNYEQKDDTIFVKIAGVIENDEAEELVEPMQEILDKEFNEVVFDMSLVPFMTSSAIGKFVIFHRNVSELGRKMRIKGVDDELYEIFMDIKLYTVFPIEQ